MSNLSEADLILLMVDISFAMQEEDDIKLAHGDLLQRIEAELKSRNEQKIADGLIELGKKSPTIQKIVLGGLGQALINKAKL